MILPVVIVLAVLAKSTHTIAYDDSILVGCSSTAADYVKQHMVSENVSITEIEQLATSIHEPGFNLSGLDEDVENSIQLDKAYRIILAIVGKEDTPTRATSFRQAVADITKAVYKSCYSSHRITIEDFPTVITAYKISRSKQNVLELRKAYGSLVCLKSLVSRRKKRTTTLAPGTPEADIINFYRSIDADDLGILFRELSRGKKFSVAFVIDDTGSMSDEIGHVKCLIRSFLKSNRDIPTQYILGTFNDPEMDTTFFSPRMYDSANISAMNKMLEDLASIKACCNDSDQECHCGGDTPELAMGGICRAIEKSIRYPHTGDELSHVLVFTDAPAKDYYKKDLVETKLKTKDPDYDSHVIVHGFLPPHLSVRSRLDATCYGTVESYNECIKNTGWPYIKVIERQSGFIVNTLTSVTGLDDFIRQFSGKYDRELRPAICSSLKRSSPGCQTFVVSKFAYQLVVLIDPHVTATYSIIDSSEAVIMSSTLSSIKLHKFDDPVSGNWSVCSEESFDMDIKIENNFQFTVVFIREDEDEPTESLPLPGCSIPILVLSPQLNLLETNVQHMDLVRLTDMNPLQVQLTHCKGYLKGLITVPKETFYFRFQGVSSSGHAFESSQLTKHVPTPWSFNLITVSAPEQISKGSSENYVFNLTTTNQLPSCSLLVDITATTTISGVTLSVSPPRVALKGSAPVSFIVKVTVSDAAPSGRGKIEIQFTDHDGDQLQNVTKVIGIGTPGCPCKNGGTCVTVRRFGRLRTGCTCLPLYLGPFCDSSACTKDCQNGGTCSGVNRCNCSSGWSGQWCDSPVCTKPCVSGLCTSPDTCNCTEGWSGRLCDQPICKISCVNGGTCTAPDRCECPSGWSGTHCKTAVCGPPCQNGGSCTNPDTCECLPGWTGSQCEAALCREPCVSGSCIAPDTCNCTEGWSGTLCDQPICKIPCENGGTCTAPDRCECPSGWSGTHCETAVCVIPCQNGGSCTNPDACACLPGWTGSQCETAFCRNPCVSGSCIAPDTCNCTEGWSGRMCDQPICEIPCENGGTCTAPDLCECPSEWSGTHCETAVCGIPCQNGGFCTVPDTCECLPGWTSSQCEIAVCGIPCQNGGSCTIPDTCGCLPGWTGSQCEAALCREPCVSGSCIAPDTCNCTEGWSGRLCDQSICKIPCENGGTCTSPDRCECPSGWSGTHCETAICVRPCQNGGLCSQPDVCTCTSEWGGAVCDIKSIKCIDSFSVGFLENYFERELQDRIVVIYGTKSTSVTITGFGRRLIIDKLHVQGNTAYTFRIPNIVETYNITTIATASVSVFGGNFATGSSGAFTMYPNSVLRENEYRYLIMSTLSARSVHKSAIVIVPLIAGGPLAIVKTRKVINGRFYGSTTQTVRSTIRRIVYDSGDFTGTEIKSNKPIAVYSGHQCARVPSSRPFCDQVVEQIPPVSALGRRYIVVGFTGRTSGAIVKILAAFNMTIIKVNCKNTIITLNTSMQYTFYLRHNETCFVSATQPFMVAQFSFGLGDESRGDPSMIILPSLDSLSNHSVVYSFPQDILMKHYLTIITEESTYLNNKVLVDGHPLPSNADTIHVQTDEDLGTYVAIRMEVNSGIHIVDSFRSVCFVMAYGFAPSSAYSYASMVPSSKFCP